MSTSSFYFPSVSTRPTRTPWGQSQQSRVIASGITRHDTASHGGYHLSKERQKELQRKFEFPTFAGGPWYEEDCDACAVIIAFPEFFGVEHVDSAIESAIAFAQWEKRDGLYGKWHRVVDSCKDAVIAI